MGLALYFPAIKALGLVDAARQSFSLPRSVIFGVRAVTLSLLFMTLLRKPTVESAKHLRRAEFGALVGTDRAPCVKTLRRKLEALDDMCTLARRTIETLRRRGQPYFDPYTGELVRPSAPSALRSTPFPISAPPIG